jgi:hypothetical protein
MSCLASLAQGTASPRSAGLTAAPACGWSSGLPPLAVPAGIGPAPATVLLLALTEGHRKVCEDFPDLQGGPRAGPARTHDRPGEQVPIGSASQTPGQSHQRISPGRCCQGKPCPVLGQRDGQAPDHPHHGSIAVPPAEGAEMGRVRPSGVRRDVVPSPKDAHRRAPAGQPPVDGIQRDAALRPVGHPLPRLQRRRKRGALPAGPTGRGGPHRRTPPPIPAPSGVGAVGRRDVMPLPNPPRGLSVSS